MAIQDEIARSALIIIDVQNDFCPGGGLAVPEGDKAIPVINRVSGLFPHVVATKDWHPDDHVSFASSHPGKEPTDTVEHDGMTQLLWPDHCVKGTEGAAFHPDLDVRPVNIVLHKGAKTHLDSYSAFFENDKTTPTGLDSYLKGLGFERVFVVGLAEDVCVYFTAMDARKLGYETAVISDATRGVDIPEGNLDKARRDMENAGVSYITSAELGV